MTESSFVRSVEFSFFSLRTLVAFSLLNDITNKNKMNLQRDSGKSLFHSTLFVWSEQENQILMGNGKRSLTQILTSCQYAFGPYLIKLFHDSQFCNKSS